MEANQIDDFGIVLLGFNVRLIVAYADFSRQEAEDDNGEIHGVHEGKGKQHSIECQTRSLHLHLEKSRRPSLHIASYDPFSATHMSYVVYALSFSFLFGYIATHIFPPHDHPLLPTSHGPSTGFSMAAFSPVVWVIAHEMWPPRLQWTTTTAASIRTQGPFRARRSVCPEDQSPLLRGYSKHINNPPGRALSLACITSDWMAALYLTFVVSGRPYDTLCLIAVSRGAGISDMHFMGYRYLYSNGFLVSITYLQHNHPALPFMIPLNRGGLEEALANHGYRTMGS
ncbi:hypothetical protein NC652_000248 [Populus alba x Populus x berolinensis]|nr:hypothetical protein NC652_000248 [Populus alba x Populus x berolinensis]